MSRPERPQFPETQRRGEALGDRLRLARLRRRMTQSELAERAGTTRITLARFERGDLSGSIGLLARILGVLGLGADLDRIASDDELGQRVQDVRLRRPRTSRGTSARV